MPERKPYQMYKDKYFILYKLLRILHELINFNKSLVNCKHIWHNRWYGITLIHSIIYELTIC